MAKKYIFHVINERNGEREYSHKGVAEIDSSLDKREWLDKYLDNLYSDAVRDPENEDGRIINGWELYIEAYEIKEIPKGEYEVLKRYL